MILDPVDVDFFSERDPSAVGSFWIEWVLDRETMQFRRRRPEQYAEMRCPHCGVRQKVTQEGRLSKHVVRGLPAGENDRRCVGAAMLVRVESLGGCRRRAGPRAVHRAPDGVGREPGGRLIRLRMVAALVAVRGCKRGCLDVLRCRSQGVPAGRCPEFPSLLMRFGFAPIRGSNPRASAPDDLHVWVLRLLCQGRTSIPVVIGRFDVVAAQGLHVVACVTGDGPPVVVRRKWTRLRRSGCCEPVGRCRVVAGDSGWPCWWRLQGGRAGCRTTGTGTAVE